MAELRLSGSRLIVRGDLAEDAEFEMRDRCRELLAGGSGPVTVDLSKAGGMSSMCIGTLVALWIDLREAGRSGKIVPSPSVLRMLEMTGLDAVLLRPPAAGKGRGDEGGEEGGGDEGGGGEGGGDEGGGDEGGGDEGSGDEGGGDEGGGDEGGGDEGGGDEGGKEDGHSGRGGAKRAKF